MIIETTTRGQERASIGRGCRCTTTQYSVDAVDQELSLHYRLAINPGMQECYRTAMLTTYMLDAALEPKYVEGVVIYWTNALTTFEMPVPFNHAFVMVEIAGQTRIVDPADHPQLPFPVAYLVGNVWSLDELHEALTSTEALPLSPHYAESAQNLAELRRIGLEVAKSAATSEQPRRRTILDNSR